MLPSEWENRVEQLSVALEAMPPDEATVRALVDVCITVVLSATNSPTTAHQLLTAALQRHAHDFLPMAKAPARLQ